MIQLTYQAAFDSYHAIFRLFRLHPTITRKGPLHRDHVRILDYYLLFPSRTEPIRLNPQDRRFKKLAKIYAHDESYVDLPEDHLLFSRMQPTQLAAIDTLAAQLYFDPEKLSSNLVVATGRLMPDAISKRVQEANSQDSELLEFLESFASYPLMGVNGVKARTGLLEYRYDAV